MKQFLLTTALALLTAVGAVAQQYDFTAQSETNILYYKITNAANKEVAVVCELYFWDDQKSYTTEPTGTLIIPETVTYNEEDYTVTSIGTDAFNRCYGLSGTLTIPNSVTSIGGGAFYDCNFTGALTIGKGLENVSGLSLSADGFTEFIVHKDNPNYSSADGILYNKDTTTIIQCPKGKTGTLTIPNSVTSIGDNAFYGCDSFTGILTIGSGVTSIGDNAFYGCGNFTKIVFDGCKGLTGTYFTGANVDTIHFTEQVSGMSFNRNAFGWEPQVSTILYDAVDWGEEQEWIFGENDLAKSVTKIIIGENVKRIPSGIFQYFDKVVEVELPDGITYIGENAFSLKTAVKNMPTIQPMNNEFAIVKGVFPTSTGHLYDIDTDGQMEVIGEVEDEDNGNGYSYTLPIATNTGIRNGNILLGDSLAYGDKRVSLAIDNIDRTGNAEVLIEQDDDGYEWLLYDVNSGDLKQQFIMPTKGDNTQRLAFDANGDGRTDYFCGHTPADSWDGDVNSFIAYQQADGSFLSKEVQIITDKDEIGEATFAQYEPNPSAPAPIVFTSISMAKSAEVPQLRSISSEMFEGGEPQAIDLNMDGLLDIVNLYNGNSLLSLGNDKYYYGTMDGEVTAKDLTGDGVPDYVIYDEGAKKVTLQKYIGNGQFESEILYQNLGMSGIHCYDFDKDGDVDILLTFDYDEGMGMAATFCAFFENKDNDFKKRECPIMNRKLYFKELKDYDNDGLYELLAYESDETEMLYTVKCKPDFSIEVSAEPFGTLYTSRANFFFSADADSDGYLETWIGYNYKYDNDNDNAVQGRIFNNTTPNTAPEKMSTPRALFDNANSILRLEWDKGVDAQQSSADLTYAIRIGTESGKGDIVYAHADATGRRLRPGEGNAAYNLYKYYMTEAWNAGTYYIAIQAIDNNGAGGAWSDELVYELTTETSEFDLSTTRFTVNDTLIVSPKTIFNPAYTYNWDFGTDATLVKNELGIWQVQYSTIGNKTITLQVTTPNDTLESYSEEVFVSGISLETRNLKGEPNYEGEFPPFHRGGSFVDLDMDGHLDLLGYYATDYYGDEGIYGVLKSNTDGTFTKFVALYNMDMTLSGNQVVLDLNMDGYPDFITSNSGKANGSNWFINDEDLYFSDEAKTFEFPNVSEGDLERYSETILSALYDENSNGTRADFNNDGYEDFYFHIRYYHCANIAINQGDNFTFKQASEEYDGIFENDEETIIAVRDMNNDGWVDLITQDEAGDHVKRYIRWNNGDMTFNEKTEMTTDIRGFDSRDYWYDRMTDFNNDGYLDIVSYEREDDRYSENYGKYRLSLLLGDATYSYSNAISLTDYKDNIVYNSANNNYVDFDNNGYLDIQVSKDNVNGILYLFEGWKTEFVRVTDVAAVEYYYDISTSLFADLNGDGTPDMTGADMISTIPNERPAAPTGVRATVGNKGMNLSWSAAVDKETPSAQMRYNISLKIKGESGEDSYILSPLNNGVDYIAPVSNKEYLRGLTSYTVPFSRFVSGTEYELKVQAFDLWNSASAFSETFTFTMSDDLFITGADKACVGNGVILTVSGNNAEDGGTPVWNLGDDATIVETDGNSVEVLWDNPGLKEVSVTMNGKEGKGAVMVHETLDLEFDLPNTILSGGYVYFTLPEAFLDASNQVKIRTSFDADLSSIKQGQFASAGSGNPRIPSLAARNKEQDGMNIERRGATLEARILVNADDNKEDEPPYWVEFVAEDKNCGSVSYRESFNVQGKNITPQISIVTVDAATGKNKIMWSEPTDLDIQSGVFDKIVVFKEMGATENFVAIAEVPIEQGEFIDHTSDPYLRKGRYCIALGTSYGGVSNPSNTHASVHVMLNKGVAPNSVNIVWTPYEGAVIDQYTILRGTSPDNMQVLTTASGYETSYTDMTMPTGDVYYALQYSNTYDTQWNPMPKSGLLKSGDISPVATGVSNAVNANAANTLTLAESIRINHIQTVAELTPDQTVLLLYTEMLPAQATYKQANWRITEGADLATITQDGMLEYIGDGAKGTVVVKATTLDGSGLSAELEVSVRRFSSIKLVESINIGYVDNLNPTNPSAQLISTVSPYNATEQDVDWSISQGDDIVTLTSSGLLIAKGINGSAVIRATAQDYSGVYDEITVTVNGFESSVLVTSINIDSVDNLNPTNPSAQLIATVSPYNATVQDVDWSISQGDDIVSLTSSGLLIAKGINGSAIIRATATDTSGVYDEITVTVNEFESSVLVTSINIGSVDNLNPTNPSAQLIATVLPYDATEQDVVWSISQGDDIVSLTSSGFLIAKGINGNAVIRATATDDSGVYDEITITVSDFTSVVENLVTSISIDSVDNLNPTNPSAQLISTISPYNATVQDVVWSISQGDDIVSLTSSGLVTAKGINGNAVIRATATDASGVYDEITVTVNGFESSVLVTSINIDSVDNLNPTNPSALLIATVSPYNATVQDVDWSISQGDDIVSLTSSGLVIAKGINGSAVIRATAKDYSGVYDEITVTVSGFESSVSVTSINIDAVDNLNPTNPSAQLIATVLPYNATEQDVDWSISQGDDIVTLTSSGLVITKGINGSAIIRATAKDDSGIYDEITVTVSGFESSVLVTSINIDVVDDIAYELVVAPMPITNNSKVLFTVKESGVYSLNLYSLLGKAIASKTLDAQYGKNVTDWQALQNLPKGVYFLALTQNGKQIALTKVVF